MSDDKFTTGPWNSFVKQIIGFDGDSKTKYYIEKNGYALAQFANFGDENEANLKLCASAPEMYELLRRAKDYFQNRHIYGLGIEGSESEELQREIQKVLNKVRE